jgi:hypothetical protein
MDFQVRTARLGDDLSRLWPANGGLRVNHDRIILVMDGQNPERPIGGVQVFSSGPGGIALVTEMATVKPELREVVAETLVHALASRGVVEGWPGAALYVEPGYRELAVAANRLGAFYAAPLEAWLWGFPRVSKN